MLREDRFCAVESIAAESEPALDEGPARRTVGGTWWDDETSDCDKYRDFYAADNRCERRVWALVCKCDADFWDGSQSDH